MSDSTPVFSIAPFQPVVVADQTPLKAQLAVIADIEAKRSLIKLWKNVTSFAVVLAVPLSGLWAATMMWWRYYHAYNWDFLLSPLLTGVPIMVVCGIVVAIAKAVTNYFDDKPVDGAVIGVTIIGGIGAAITGFFTFLGTLPFTLPFLVWAVLVVAKVHLGTWPHLGSKLAGSDRRVDKIIADNRYAELCSFLQLQGTWSDYAQLLNRLALKLQHNQIDPQYVPRVVEGLTALRASEKFVQDRLQYMYAIAAEGELGSRTARADLTDVAIHDLSGRMDDMREQVAKLREIDRKAVAALQVATNQY